MSERKIYAFRKLKQGRRCTNIWQSVGLHWKSKAESNDKQSHGQASGANLIRVEPEGYWPIVD